MGKYSLHSMRCPGMPLNKRSARTTPLIRQAVISGADLSAATLSEQLGQPVSFDLNTSTGRGNGCRRMGLSWSRT